MIYCVWYPSGGFGHFVNSILNLHGQNFCRPKNQLVFSRDGNSHSLDYAAPPYTKDQNFYNHEFDTECNYSLIVDNGINNEGTNFTKFFPQATIIKMCYTDYSWPMVAQTSIVKAMHNTLDQEITVDQDSWPANEPWAQREKYFLFLRDHPLRHSWKPSTISHNILVEDLADYSSTVQSLTNTGAEINNFSALHSTWWEANKQYFLPITLAGQFVNGDNLTITDIWTQAIVYYQIWCQYGIEVPHNELADFFSSQQHYQDWLRSVL